MRKYSKDHEWIEQNGEVVTVGITDYAQHALGDVVYVELPKVGREVKQGQETAVVESVKAASDVYAPISGIVLEVNEALAQEPALVNRDASTAWFFKLRYTNIHEIDALMSEADYQALLKAST